MWMIHDVRSSPTGGDLNDCAECSNKSWLTGVTFAHNPGVCPRIIVLSCPLSAVITHNTSYVRLGCDVGFWTCRGDGHDGSVPWFSVCVMYAVSIYCSRRDRLYGETCVQFRFGGVL